LLKESDDDEDDNNEAKSKIESKSQKTNKINKTNKKSEKASANTKKGHDAWIQENEDEDPLDLLDPMAIKRVFATKPLTKEEIEKKKSKGLAEKNRGFKMSSDGRLLIDEDDEDDNEEDDKKSRTKKNKKPDHLDEMMDTLSISKKSSASKKSKQKRPLDGDDSDDEIIEDNKSKFSYKTGGSGIHRKILNKKEPVDYGSEYRSKVFKFFH
jgi:ribosomal RNA-processing protein 12